MGETVRTAGGATEENPCPTELSKWFTKPWCSAGDYIQWRDALSALYVGGLVPTYDVLRAIDAESNDHQASNVAYSTLSKLQAEAAALPQQGSQISHAQNLANVTRTMALMVMGENLLAMMRNAITERGGVAPDYALPSAPATMERKPAWRRWLVPGLLATGGLLVGGLTIAAVVSRGR